MELKYHPGDGTSKEIKVGNSPTSPSQPHYPESPLQGMQGPASHLLRAEFADDTPWLLSGAHHAMRSLAVRREPNIFGADLYREILEKDPGDEPPVPSTFARALGPRLVLPDHKLVLVPNTLNGKRCTPAYMIKLLERHKGDHPVIYPDTDSRLLAGLNVAPKESYWAVLRTKLDRQFHGKTNAEQETLLANLPRYRTATLHETLAWLALHGLKTHRRLHPMYLLRCAEPAGKGSHLAVGLFDEAGLVIESVKDSDTRFNISRALALK